MFKKINHLILHLTLTLLNALTPEPATSTKVLPDEPKIDFAIGGQAVIEGVMMRSPSAVTISVRSPKGDIVTQEKKYTPFVKKHPAFNIPILRGIVGLVEMTIIGTKAINWSAAQSLEEDNATTGSTTPDKTASRPSKLAEILTFTLSIIIGAAFSLFLFKFLPLGTTTFLQDHIPLLSDNYLLFNTVDATIKALIFTGYIYLLSLIPSFRRIFEYHGAEHKSIMNYENNLPLTVENADKQTRFHPRCGTSFIIIVFILGIIFYTVIPKQDIFLLNFLRRLLFLPLLAGISYELLRLTAKYNTSKWVKPLTKPGLAFQRLTTREPDKAQLEVGLESLKAALRN
ncbi:DUF1385 domain-containing protein [Candidatus Peregrinibacteria bacterium HGW-Peregrinibacteria-1]|jgi:uncharacterized protein YqhQ|nr:MAG: DUF1385 domain-containing protein [Candidatus Peregrinibacteria bacterium HGW-Peregrinibacteria-1]